jgi:outer membrane protein assembly factor BamB
MKHMKKSVPLVLISAALLAGCNPFNKSRPKTPVVGDRVSVLVRDVDISVDPATAATPFSLPAAVANTEWSQPGGNASKSFGHLALGSALANAFSVSIGAGTTSDSRLASAPVVAVNKVFTIDTTATVRAFDAANGRQLWATAVGVESNNRSSLFGGGVAVSGGRVYATNGLGYAAALDAGNGGVIWSKKIGGPLRGAPSVDGETIYVMSQDNQIYSLNAADGSQRWSNPAALETAGVFGTGAPAVAQSTVVAGFSSGELNAYRAENGRLVWQDALSRTSISTSVATLSDIDASPVIDNGQVFAVGQGGRMVALDLISGQRIWELNIAGISTPWVAGDWVYVVTDDAKLVSIARNPGKVRWINQLPAYLNQTKKAGPISYVGPILAGDRLIVAGSNGVLVNVDPSNGSFQSQTNVGAPVQLSPVVANSTLYLLDNRGRLHAFR